MYDGPQAPPPAYQQLLRRGRPGIGWPLLGIGALGLGLVIASQVAGLLAYAGCAILGGEVSLDPVTPGGLAAVNLMWALAIPAALWAVAVVHHVRPGWLVSVAGRMRWRWLATCLGLSVVVLAVTLGVAALLPAEAATSVDLEGGLNPWSSGVRDFLLVVVLLTPLQAAGEEFVFRGYLTQAVGSLTRTRSERAAVAASIVVPAFLFALAHGGQDLPVFVDRFAFGLVAGVLVIVTGGLEAGIAMHVLNNLFAYGLALAFSDMNSAVHPEGGSWWSLPATLVQSLGFLMLVGLVARRQGVANRAEPPMAEPNFGSERGRM